MAFVFEGDFDLGAVELDLAVAENHVLRYDLRYAQLAQMFSGLLDHVLGSVFPAFGAGADEFDNVVSAIGMGHLVTTLRHERISSSTNTLPPSTDPTPKITFCPAETTPLNRKRGSFISAKVLNSTEDVHAKNMSTFEIDEHLLTAF
jgi:hypothetical protein